MNDAQSSSQTFVVSNLGDYDLSGCITNMSLLQGYLTTDVSSFTVGVGLSTNVLVTMTNIPAGTYSDTMTVTCYATASNGIDTDTSSISATITVAPAVVVTPTGGGGATPYIPPVDVDVEPDDIFEIADLDLKFKRYTSTITKQKWDEFRILNKNAFDLNVTLSFKCVGDDPSCEWMGFVSVNNTIIPTKEYWVKWGGRTAGLQFDRYIQNIPKDTPVGNYSFILHAVTSTGTVQEYHFVMVISDEAPGFQDMFGVYIYDNPYLSLFLSLFVVAILITIFALKQKKKRKLKAILSSRDKDAPVMPSMDDEFV